MPVNPRRLVAAGLVVMHVPVMMGLYVLVSEAVADVKSRFGGARRDSSITGVSPSRRRSRE